MYLDNTWYGELLLFYAILHQAVVIQDNSMGVLFNDLLAELPAILDTNTTSDYIGVVGRGQWGVTVVAD